MMRSSPINFLEGISRNGNRDKRLSVRRNLNESQKKVLEKFDYEYFDTDLGYGRYRYDGRYGLAAERMIGYYGLKSGDSVLDVGCAKGFLVYEFQIRLGSDRLKCAYGSDVSTYAIEHGKPEVRSRLYNMSAHQLDFQDRQFDFVVSIDTLHNLPDDLAQKAISEMMRVSRGKCFLQVASFETPEEEEALHAWGVTLKTFYNKQQWLSVFKKLGFTGEYWFKTFTL